MRKKVLIVDDSEFAREVLKNILKDDYTIIEAGNGKEALAVIEEQRKEIAAILLDMVMPEMDGVTLLKILHEKQYFDDFPVLVVTSEQSVNLVGECFDYGISDFIRKPVNTDFVKERVDKLVQLYMKKNDYKEKLIKQTLNLRNQYKLVQQQAAQLKKSNEKIIDALGTVVEYRNMEERVHVKKVKEFTRILATYMMQDYPEYELTEQKINVIASASVLHDLGKVMIPDSILLKPGKLTEEEEEYLKSHTLRGYEIVNSITDVWDQEYAKYSREITRFHHERYDGSGYPDELKGDDIPISAQIVSVADCYESLISENVNNDAVSYDDAYNAILQGECGVFSYKLLECFRKARKEMEDYAESCTDNMEDE